MHITKINQYYIYWSIDIFLHLSFWININISEFTLKVNTAFWLKCSLPFTGIRVSCITMSLSICESRWWWGRIKVEKIRNARRSKIRCLDVLSYKSWKQQQACSPGGLETSSRNDQTKRPEGYPDGWGDQLTAVQGPYRVKAGGSGSGELWGMVRRGPMNVICSKTRFCFWGKWGRATRSRVKAKNTVSEETKV